MGINHPDCVKQLAEIGSAQQQLQTGHPPKQVDVAFAGDALVMVFNDALTTAEQELAKDPQAANHLLAFHRDLGDKGGSKDKSKKEKQKKAKQSPKEKRKARTEKKKKSNTQMRALD